METTKQIEAHLSANMNISKKDIVVGNFLGGLSWGLGTVIGATLMVAVLIFTLKALGVFEPLKPLFESVSVVKQLQDTTK